MQFHIARYLYWISTDWIDLVKGDLPDSKTLNALLPSWASPQGWKREVLKLDGNPLSQREKLDAAALLVDYKQEKGPEAVAGALDQLGYTEAIEDWTTGMLKKFVTAVGALPEKAAAS